MGISKSIFTLLFILIVCQAFGQNDSAIFQNLKEGEVIEVYIDRNVTPVYLNSIKVTRLKDSVKISYWSFHGDYMVYPKAKTKEIRQFYEANNIKQGRKYPLDKSPYKLNTSVPDGISWTTYGKPKEDSSFYCPENVLLVLNEFENGTKTNQLKTVYMFAGENPTWIKIKSKNGMFEKEISGFFYFKELTEYYSINPVRKEIY